VCVSHAAICAPDTPTELGLWARHGSPGIHMSVNRASMPKLLAIVERVVMQPYIWYYLDQLECTRGQVRHNVGHGGGT